jgi:ParB family chromosome partitioning protein
VSRDTSSQRRALGRGLDALIPAPAISSRRDYFLCPIDKVVARGDQPRRRFDEDALEELAQSIREQGVIQPIVVRRAGDDFEIIAGERRWRAAQRVGLREVPVVVKDVSPARAYEMALVENLQREDLNPLERAEAYRRLIEEHGLKHDQLAQRVGKGRSTIANSLRLLSLPAEVGAMLASGEITEGHARALLAISEPGTLAAVARRVAKLGLSVRQTERAARVAADGGTGTRVHPPGSPQIAHLEKQLRQKLGCVVQLKDRDGKGNKGSLVLHYTSSEQLERLLDVLLAR